MPTYGLQRALVDGFSMVRLVALCGWHAHAPKDLEMHPESKSVGIQKFGMRDHSRGLSVLLASALRCTDARFTRWQTFLTLLSGATAPVLEGLISCHILKGMRAGELCRAPPEPPGAQGTHVLFEQFWVEVGPAPLPEADAHDEFVLTPSVRGHLSTLARAVLLRKHPILLQVRHARLRCMHLCALLHSPSSAKMKQHSSD